MRQACIYGDSRANRFPVVHLPPESNSWLLGAPPFLRALMVAKRQQCLQNRFHAGIEEKRVERATQASQAVLRVQEMDLLLGPFLFV